MAILTIDHKRNQSPGEEVANSISHGVGVVAAIIGTPFLILQAIERGHTGFLVGSAVFSASLILLFLASTLYHALPRNRAKQVFRAIEHSAIFVLIAGTYTPITLGILRGTTGWILFGVVWTIAAVGILLKVLGRFSHPVLSSLLYLGMGWLVVFAVGPLLELMQPAGLWWLLAGGLAYSLGVIFYITDWKIRYGHLAWHLFVLAGATCHYFAILWYGV